MEAVNSTSSFEAIFFELQEYCDQFEEFNEFKQDLKLQTKFEGEKSKRPWVYEEYKSGLKIFCYGIVIKCSVYWRSLCSG